MSYTAGGFHFCSSNYFIAATALLLQDGFRHHLSTLRVWIWSSPSPSHFLAGEVVACAIYSWTLIRRKRAAGHKHLHGQRFKSPQHASLTAGRAAQNSLVLWWRSGPTIHAVAMRSESRSGRKDLWQRVKAKYRGYGHLTLNVVTPETLVWVWVEGGPISTKNMIKIT